MSRAVAGSLQFTFRMLGILMVVAVAQVEEPWTPPPPPPAVHIEAPSAQLQELTELRQLTASLRTQIELGRQVSALSVEIATFDDSGPGWAQGLRVISYLLAAPAFVLAAPVINGRSPAVFGLAVLSGGSTVERLGPTFDTIGIALACTVGVTLVVGILGGFVGWLSKRYELDGLTQAKAALEVEWAQLRLDGVSYASRR